MICHQTLLDLLHNTSVPESLTKWLANYLSGRQAKTQFRDPMSITWIVRTCVLQGSVISPTLSIFYEPDAPESPEVKPQSYANDLHSFVQLRDIKHASTTLINYLNEQHDFFYKRSLIFFLHQKFSQSFYSTQQRI